VLLLLAATGLLLAGAGPASAHAVLTGSDPRQGAVVGRAPAQVSLTFSEKVTFNPGSPRVLDPHGRRVDTGQVTATGESTYAVRLRGGLGDGTYTVTYQVVSADSHPVGGAYTFSVGAPSATSVAVGGQEAGGGTVGVLYGIGRYVSYAGYVVLAGGAAFVLACWPGGAGVRIVQRTVTGGWVALTAATLALLLLRGAYTTSGRLGDIVDLDLLGQVLQTKAGAALVGRLLLLAAAAVFAAVLFGMFDKRAGEDRRRLTTGLAIVGVLIAAGLATSWAVAEHASTGLQPAVAMPVDVIHLLAVAAWFGGLVTVLTVLYRAPAGTQVPAGAVRRFSTVAFGAVLALVATGTYQAWRQVGSWSALTGTRYGQLLLVKVALVLAMVALARFSRRWTARLAEAKDGGAPATAEQGGTPEKSGQPTTEATEQAGGEGTGAAGPGAEAVSRAAGRGTDGSGTATLDPQRAAQLARQRAAMEAARRRRERDADPNRSGLRRSVLAEAAVAVVVLAVTTVLTQTEPARTEQEAAAAPSSSASAASTGPVALRLPFDTGGPHGKGVVQLDLEPARVGGNEMHVYVEGPDGQPLDVPEITVVLTLPAQRIGPLPVAVERVAGGHWAATGVQIPMAGDWKVAVSVRTSDIDEVTVTKNAQIG
jgi:copper transport protein